MVFKWVFTFPVGSGKEQEKKSRRSPAKSSEADEDVLVKRLKMVT